MNRQLGGQFELKRRPRLGEGELFCTYCGTGANIMEDDLEGFMVCTTCGLRVARVVDYTAENRTFANDDDDGKDTGRAGTATNPLLDDDTGTKTAIGGTGHRATKLKKAHWGADPKDALLNKGYVEIDMLEHKLGCVRRVTERAKVFFKQYTEVKKLRNQDTKALAAVALLYAGREEGLTRSVKEISGRSGVQLKTFNKTLKVVQETRKEHRVNTQVAKPKDLIPGYVSVLKRERIRLYCEEVATVVDSHSIAGGRSPPSVSAAIIYFVSHLIQDPNHTKPVTLKEVENISGQSKTTIRQSYKPLWEERETICKNVKALENSDVDQLPVP
eukprot:Clim_evm10s16 gene=Clim_evmTU10s16